MNRLLLLLLLMVCCGCERASSNGGTVSGTVTVDGQLLTKGFVSFFPEGGVDGVGKAEIVDGHYRIDSLTLGKKRVLITAWPQTRVVTNAAGKKRAIIDPAKSIPPNAVGNNQIVEISTDITTLNLQLTQRGG